MFLAAQKNFILISGTAAFNVDGKTLHSLLQIPIAKKANEEMRELDGDPLMRLQMNLQGTRIIVIDEMSMISPGFLYKVNRRLQQAFPEHKTKPFGGCTIILMGDFAQLPPVMAPPLYQVKQRNHPQ